MPSRFSPYLPSCYFVYFLPHWSSAQSVQLSLLACVSLCLPGSGAISSVLDWLDYSWGPEKCADCDGAQNWEVWSENCEAMWGHFLSLTVKYCNICLERVLLLNIKILIRQSCHIKYATVIDLQFQIYIKKILKTKIPFCSQYFVFSVSVLTGPGREDWSLI